MITNEVYQSDVELARLTTQSRLFKAVENQVYQDILRQYPHGCVLDVGSNNGVKSADRFANGDDILLDKVVGVEFHKELVDMAQSRFGNQTFAFYQCDVEAASFAQRLAEIMALEGVVAFDVIHISLVLLHLKNPAWLLKVLHDVLAPDGRLLVIEANDQRCAIYPDPDHLCQGFVKALSQNPYGGNRGLGARLPALLTQSGFVDVVTHIQQIDSKNQVGYGEQEMKQDLYDTFVSYLKEDAERLRQSGDPAYGGCIGWVDDHFHQLKALALAEESQVTMGLLILTCGSNGLGFSPLQESDLEQVKVLSDQCVGENLYPRSALQGIIQKPDHHFLLLRTADGQLAGYIYFYLTDLQDMSRFSNLPVEQLAEMCQVASPVLGHLQAVAVAPEFRKRNLSKLLVERYLTEVARLGADVACGVFWKPNEQVSMEKTLVEAGFVHLADAHDVWADKVDLRCPYCKGRCHCDGAVFYKNFSRL